MLEIETVAEDEICPPAGSSAKAPVFVLDDHCQSFLAGASIVSHKKALLHFRTTATSLGGRDGSAKPFGRSALF